MPTDRDVSVAKIRCTGGGIGTVMAGIKCGQQHDVPVLNKKFGVLAPIRCTAYLCAMIAEHDENSIRITGSNCVRKFVDDVGSFFRLDAKSIAIGGQFIFVETFKIVRRMADWVIIIIDHL